MTASARPLRDEDVAHLLGVGGVQPAEGREGLRHLEAHRFVDERVDVVTGGLRSGFHGFDPVGEPEFSRAGCDRIVGKTRARRC